MRTLTLCLASAAAVAGLTLAPPAAHAGELEWLSSLDQGLAEARQSGRAILYVTLWKPGT